MTAVTNDRKLVKYENQQQEPPKKKSFFDCCKPKTPTTRKKHSRQFTQHEIDYTINERAKAALKSNKSKRQVFVEPWDFTETKAVKVEEKKT